MIRRVVALVRLPSRVPVMVRAAVFAAGLAALLLAMPAAARSTPAVVAGLAGLALLAAILPGSVWVTLVVLTVSGAWVAATLVGDQPITAPRVLALAGLLYLLHSLATLAATLPYDAAVGGDVWVRWLVRTGVVIVAAWGLSLVLLVGLAQLPDSGMHLLATLGGLGLAATLVGLLSVLARRG